VRYLIVSCTLFDAGGLAMVNGAINGIRMLDDSAEFASLHAPEHHKDGIMKTFVEPEQDHEAFAWADVILDIGGLCDLQANRYTWAALREKYHKPLIWMSQSFKGVDTSLLEGTHVVCRGSLSLKYVMSVGGYDSIAVAPDLSFLLDPTPWRGKPYKRVFSTNIARDLAVMRNIACLKSDVQAVEKPPRGRVWEEELPIDTFHGTPEELFGLVESVEEVHTARYQIACAAILSGKRPVIYMTGDDKYDQKYIDLMEYFGLDRSGLRRLAMQSCEVAVEVARRGS